MQDSMASPSAAIDSDVTIFDTTSFNFPDHEIPPAVLDVQEAEIVCFSAFQWMCSGSF
jgi:hypothetical protein